MLNCQQAIIVVVLTLMINVIRIVASEPFCFQQQAHMIPHPQKAHRGGQDAYFSSSQLLIVADGVGGWNRQGIDPSKYSRFLCSKGADIFEKNKKFYRQNPVQIISQASRLNQNIGSSTMVVLTLDGTTLKSCYIGDSGFIIIRQTDGQLKILHEFEEQQHGFNFPFQLAKKEFNGDNPYLSICQDFQVKENDIIVVGSDGLFDNVYVEEILELIKKTHNDEKKLYALKEKLAKLAIERGQDTTFISPFSKKAEQHKLRHLGGKLDDTTVIIGKIKSIKKQIKTDEEQVHASHNSSQNSL